MEGVGGIPVPWKLGRWGSAAYGHIDTNWSKPCPNPQGELDQVADTRTTTSASRPQTATAAQLLPPPHGSIDDGEVGFDICSLLFVGKCCSTTLTPFSLLSTVQHSLRSLFLFFLQYNTHLVLYSAQHSLRSLFFLQYNIHSVLYSYFFLQYNTHSVLYSYSFYSTTLTPFSILIFSTVQHSLRSLFLFFLQYNTHSVLYSYSFYSTTLTPFSTVQHSLRSTVKHSLRSLFLFFLQYNTHSVLFFQQYNTHSVLYSFYSTTLTPFSILSTVQHSLRSLFLFFLQYKTHSVLYSFYSTTLTPFSILSTVQHSLRSLQYNIHSVL